MMLLDKWDLVQSGMQPLKHSAEFAHWYHWQDDTCNIRLRYINLNTIQVPEQSAYANIVKNKLANKLIS